MNRLDPLLFEQPAFPIPFPTPDMDAVFWSPPAEAVCRSPAGEPCKWAGICSTPRQTVNHQAGIFGPSCPNHVLLDRTEAACEAARALSRQ